MSEEILVNVTPMETRVAVVDNGATRDIHIERAASRGTVGNIYCGKVMRVLPGMQAAFVDCGTGRNSFIHVADLVGGDTSADEAIADHLREGQQVIVQVTKDPLGSKGARLTGQLSLSARYLVYMPAGDHVGVSQKIEDDEERKRLQDLLREALLGENVPAGGSYILRTAAEGIGLEEIAHDLRFLSRLWSSLNRRGGEVRGPQLLHEDLSLAFRTVRDLARPGVERIRIDSRETFAAVQSFCQEYVPEVTAVLEHYAGERPLFELHGVEEEIRKAMSRRVDLASGGYLIIDQTEAMSTIDVNTGSFVGRRNLEETLFKTNLEAAMALARQLRLRNLGGIIIIDFIDMRDAQHRRQVHRALENALMSDPARTRITGVSELGLVEMTRKRSRESLEQLLCEDCSLCQGRGVLKTPETVCFEILREIMRDARAYENSKLRVLASQEVVDLLLDEQSAHVADLEEFTGKTLSFRVEPTYSQEHFDIVLL
jgi:ribonuclease G